MDVADRIGSLWRTAQRPDVVPEEASETVRALRMLTAAAIVVPILLFFAAAFEDRSVVLQRAEDDDGLKTIALLHEQAANLFGGHEIILDTIVNRVRGLDWSSIESSKDLLRDLEVMDNRLDDESAILLVDAAEKVRATTVSGAGPLGVLAADHECFVALRQGRSETCISQSSINPVTKRTLFSLVRRLENNGVFIGVAQVAISTDYFLDLWRAVTSNGAHAVMLARADGSILVRYPQIDGLPSRLAPDDPLMAGMQRSDTGVIRGHSLDNVERITAFKKIGAYPAFVSIGLDKNAILSEWHHNLFIYGVFALAALVALVLAAGAATRRAHHERRAVALWRSEVKQREMAQAQLLQSQKMESIGQLTGGVAHDFNNLLTAVIGNMDMMQDCTIDERARRLLMSAQHAAESAANLTQHLLAFARKQHLQPMPVDLRQLVGGMQDMLGRTLGASVQLSVAADDRLWPALVDPHQTELAILNLAINARDAMPRGGRLTIALANETVTAGVSDELRVGDYVVLRVTDTGIGMDEGTLARAVEPFFTTKDIGKGTGLGLSMVHGIVMQLGGAMRIDSRPGRGTTVNVWLPRSHETADVVTRAKGHVLERGDATILVCDDNPSVRDFAVEALLHSGYRAIATDSGPSALEVVADEKTAIDLLLVDFAMPGMNGAEVARRARERRPRLPILMITGNVEQAVVRSEAEGVPLLSKPFRQAQLVSRIAELLKGA